MARHTPEDPGKNGKRMDVGTAIVIGALVGLVIGTALGKLVLGMGVGMCLGIVVAALSNMRNDR
ncbi:MAG TPA: hypothetical protein ENN10_03785 [Actinobacteria bacterium]|nr:hypothetical protein [Actinomycetota bacterium]